MSDTHLTIFADDESWSLGLARDGDAAVESLALPQSATAAQIADGIVAALKANDLAPEKSAILALPSHWCLAAEFSTDQMAKSPTNEGLSYRLEDQLPIAAEEYTADFVVHGESKAFGICVVTDRVKSLVEALELKGIRVQHICPAAFLAAQEIATSDTNAKDDIIVICTGAGVDLFLLRDGRPCAWRWSQDGEQLLQRELRLRRADGNGAQSIAVWNGESAATFCRDSGYSSVRTGSTDAGELATTFASEILKGVRSPWIDLRRGALASPDPLRRIERPLAFVLSALIVLLLVLAGGMIWRTHRYNALADDQARSQLDLFNQLFPHQTPPMDVTIRLQAEERRLKGLSGDMDKVQVPPSSLSFLQVLLSALPRDLRYRVLEMRLEGGNLYLEGEARSHGDAEAVANAVAKGAGLAIDPPKSEQRQDGGVNFTMLGALPDGGALIAKGVR